MDCKSDWKKWIEKSARLPSYGEFGGPSTSETGLQQELGRIASNAVMSNEPVETAERRYWDNEIKKKEEEDRKSAQKWEDWKNFGWKLDLINGAKGLYKGIFREAPANTLSFFTSLGSGVGSGLGAVSVGDNFWDGYSEGKKWADRNVGDTTRRFMESNPVARNLRIGLNDMRDMVEANARADAASQPNRSVNVEDSINRSRGFGEGVETVSEIVPSFAAIGGGLNKMYRIAKPLAMAYGPHGYGLMYSGVHDSNAAAESSENYQNRLNDWFERVKSTASEGMTNDYVGNGELDTELGSELDLMRDRGELTPEQIKRIDDMRSGLVNETVYRSSFIPWLPERRARMIEPVFSNPRYANLVSDENMGYLANTIDESRRRGIE